MSLQKYTRVFCILAILMCALANTNAIAKGSDLFDAASNGKLSQVKSLLTKKVDVNAARGSDGATAIILAAQNGYYKVVQSLIDAKADVNVKDNDGKTALIWAAQKGYKKVVQALLTAKADVNIIANDGSTALILAEQNGHKEIEQSIKTVIAANKTVTNADITPVGSSLLHANTAADSVDKINIYSDVPEWAKKQWGPIGLNVIAGEYKLSTGTTALAGSKLFVPEEWMTFKSGLLIDVGKGGVTLKGIFYPNETKLIINNYNEIIQRSK